jgi:hypothetical protein
LVTFLLPISTLLLGAMFLHEAITSAALSGMAPIGVGLVAIDGKADAASRNPSQAPCDPFLRPFLHVCANRGGERYTGHGGGPYVSRLEADMRDVKAAGSRLEATTMRIEAMLAAALPQLATKAELRADLPSKTCMWAILAVLLTAYACGLAGLAVLK